MRATYENPFHAIIAALFIIVAMNHMRLGIQVVVEDYVHGWAGKAALILNTMFCWFFAAAGVIAVIMIALGG